MKKTGKRRIDVSKLNPPNQMSKNVSIPHPSTGSPVFSRIPEICSGDLCLPAGPVYLKSGEQRSIRHGGGGFGVQHIWHRHSKDLTRLGYNTETDVARYVADILIPGAAIYSEFETLGRKAKITVVQGRLGIVVLETRILSGVESDYGVITAYPGKPKGPQIGSLL